MAYGMVNVSEGGSTETIVGSGAPTSSVVAEEGQRYYDEIEKKSYICTAVNSDGSTVWSAAGASEAHAGQHSSGGDDPIVPESIGAASAADLNNHIRDTYNPHGLNASDVGAINQLAAYYNAATGVSVDNLLDGLALVACSSTLNSELYGVIGDTFTYVMTGFFGEISAESNRFQMAWSYKNASPAMAFREKRDEGWTKWAKVATTDYAVNRAGDFMKGRLRFVPTDGDASGAIYKHILSGVDYGTYVLDTTDDDSVYAAIRVIASSQKIQAMFRGAGESADHNYELLHTGNKNLVSPADIGAAGSVHNHAAGDVNSGTFAAERIPNLAASKINSGTFTADRIPNLSAGKITSGTFAVGRGGTGKASWTTNRLIYPSASTTLSQLAFPSVAGSVLRQGTSGAPYWTSISDLAVALTGSGLARVVAGSYTGNYLSYDEDDNWIDAKERTISLGFTPKAVILRAKRFDQPVAFYGTRVEDGLGYSCYVDRNGMMLAVAGSPQIDGGGSEAVLLQVVTNGFKVFCNGAAGIGVNLDGVIYNYVAFG